MTPRSRRALACASAALALVAACKAAPREAATVPAQVRAEAAPPSTVSLLDFVPAHLHASIRTRTNTTDVSAYVQAAVDRYADPTAPVARLHVPAGQYRIERTVVLKGHQILAGELGDRNLAGNPGSEFVWAGPDGAPAFVTSPDDDSDWSRAGIENVAISNASARSSGWGLAIRNPQNGAFLRHVFVRGFPSGQVRAYEPASRRPRPGQTPGATPGYWFVEDLLAIGGRVPVEIEAGVEPAEIRQLGVGTDSTTTVGVRLRRSPLGQAQRAPIVVTSSFVEIASGTGDIHGFEWTDDLAVTFISTSVQRNGTSPPSTKAAFHYAGRGRSIPTAEIVNSTSWQMAFLYAFDAAALSVAAADRSVPESFSWTRLHTDAALPFSREALEAGLRDQPMNASASVAGARGVVMHRAGTVVGLSAQHTAPIDAGGVTVTIRKNGGTYVRSLRLDRSRASASEDFTVGTTIDRADFHFSAGDRIALHVDTDRALAPVGGHVMAHAFVRFR